MAAPAKVTATAPWGICVCFDPPTIASVFQILASTRLPTVYPVTPRNAVRRPTVAIQELCAPKVAALRIQRASRYSLRTV